MFLPSFFFPVWNQTYMVGKDQWLEYSPVFIPQFMKWRKQQPKPWTVSCLWITNIIICRYGVVFFHVNSTRSFSICTATIKLGSSIDNFYLQPSAWFKRYEARSSSVYWFLNFYENLYHHIPFLLNKFLMSEKKTMCIFRRRAFIRKVEQ